MVWCLAVYCRHAYRCQQPQRIYVVCSLLISVACQTLGCARSVLFNKRQTCFMQYISAVNSGCCVAQLGVTKQPAATAVSGSSGVPNHSQQPLHGATLQAVVPPWFGGSKQSLCGRHGVKSQLPEATVITFGHVTLKPDSLRVAYFAWVQYSCDRVE